MPENARLLTKNTITVNGSKRVKDNLYPYINQRPNSKLFWKPIQLYIYGWPSKNFEKKWDNKILKYKDSSHFFTRVLSLKQTIGYANFRKDLANWFLENGEKPVLLDDLKTEKTQRNLRLYYIDQGFFNTSVEHELDTLTTKKVEVLYKINTKQAYYLDTISHQIASPVIDSLYLLHKKSSFIKEKQQYRRQNFEKEAERLTKSFRNAGIYHFSKYSINFREIDSTRTDHKTNVLLDITDRFIEGKDSLISVPYEVFHIDKVKVYTDYSYLQRDNYLKDSISYNGIGFYAYQKVNYKAKYLSQAIFIKPGEKYSDINNELTRKHLRNLSNFKSIRINYEELPNNRLTAHILLTPSKRYAAKAETEATHSNQKPLGVSAKLSFTDKNTFRGNEILKLSLQGSFLNSVEFASENKFFNAWEIGFDISFKVPRFVLPFNTQKLVTHSMSPKTEFTLGMSLQKNIGLDKQRFSGIIAYNWKPSKKISHAVDLINAQYIRNLNTNSFFDVYSSEFRKLKTIQSNNASLFPIELLNHPTSFITTALSNDVFQQNNPEDFNKVQNIKKRYDIITEDVLVPAITYQFIYNTQTSYKDTNFFYFRSRVSSSGLLTSLLAKSPVEDVPKQVLGINVAQYFKLDLEFRKHWSLRNKTVLAHRTNIGIAVPYGNSTSIPFSRSYFAGGPNDLRAWRIYDLGPGSENSGLEFNVGNFKVLSSLEYRFNIIGNFKGALFSDMGNIWDISKNDLTSEDAKFSNLSSLKNIALGTGIGLRYDFSFLVFRADLGFKTYEPYNPDGKRWFQNYNIEHSVLNIGINYPF